MTVTPQIRFGVQDGLNELDRQQPHRGRYQRAIRASTYWESFQGSYTSEQVAAAEELMVAYYEYLNVNPLTDQAVDRFSRAVDAVSALMTDQD